ncbi:MAG: PD40 domain-containing protein, partial [Bryobacterales bacterium]|nr:PD40 domain-containing protein [Bryobacterales bacterium]
RKLRGWTSDVFLVNLTPSLLPEGEPALIGPRMFAPAWAHDGSELFLVESPMRPSLWRVPSHAKSPPIRVREPFEAAFPAISSTGNHHAYSVIQIKTDIWQAQLTPQPNTPKPLIASTYLDIVPDFSPDGKRIAFTSARSGNTEIWTANSDGSQAVQLTHHNLSEADCPSFSPDGTRILYHANLDNFRDVMLIDAAGGQPRRLTYKEGRDVAPSWSRDGHWIYYASARSGGSTLWKLPVSGGPPQPVTTGSRAEESTDGKTLFVDDAGALWSMPVAGGPRTRLLTRNWANANFRVRHNGIYILADRALQFYDFQSKQTKQVFPTPSLASWGLAVSPDGSRVLFTQSQPEEADILMVSGFR